MDKMKYLFGSIILLALSGAGVYAGEADIVLPPLDQVTFDVMGHSVRGLSILNVGLVVCAIGMLFGWIQYRQTKALPVHRAMAEVSNTIWETCKTYVLQQGKFLAVLWALIAACMIYYFKVLSHIDFGRVIVMLLASILDILCAYCVHWFVFRINTVLD